MTDERHEWLIENYLQGRLGAAEIREVDALVRTDPRFRAALATAAHDEAALAGLYGGRKAIGSGPSAAGRTLRRFVAAGVGLAAVAAAAAIGWLWLSGAGDDGGACRVVETRGSVLLLARAAGEEATPLAAGDAIVAERRIWTCPWGAVALRLADGTRLQIDRDSEAAVACGRRPQVDLIRGTAFVTRDRGTVGSAVLKTAQASIEVGQGLAAVVVDGDRTVVEVAEGETSIIAAGGVTTRIAAGQVAILEKDGDGGVQVRQGRLEWQLPDESPGPAPAAGS